MRNQIQASNLSPNRKNFHGQWQNSVGRIQNSAGIGGASREALEINSGHRLHQNIISPETQNRHAGVVQNFNAKRVQGNPVGIGDSRPFQNQMRGQVTQSEIDSYNFSAPSQMSANQKSIHTFTGQGENR